MNTWQELEGRLTAGVSERMLELVGIGPGMRVLDLAIGYGEPSCGGGSRKARSRRRCRLFTWYSSH